MDHPKLYIIREQDPLKQGLKPNAPGVGYWKSVEIREQDPLKQGLKPKTQFLTLLKEKHS